MSRPAPWAPLLLWVVPALWSSNYLIARASHGVIAPHALAFGRWALALLLMLPFVAPALWRQREDLRREWRHLLVLGALGMWVCGAFVYQAGHSTSAINIALLYAVAPVAITAVSLRMLKERMGLAQRMGVAMALSGVVFVIAKGDLDNLLAVRLTAGDAWATVASACWVAYSVLLKRWPSALSPAVRLAAIITGGLLVLAPFTLAEALWVERTVWSSKALGLVVAGAVLPGVLSYTAYSYLQRELGASRTALLLYLAPVYGALGAWVVLGEPPGWYHVAGAGLILPSIWLATRPAGR